VVFFANTINIIIGDIPIIINSPSGKWEVQSNNVSAIAKAPLTKPLSNIKKCLFPQNNIDEIYSITDIPNTTSKTFLFIFKA